MKTGLLFGSFNPIHKGHVALARYFVEQTDLDQVWLVLTPKNPLKEASELLPNDKRLAMVQKVAAQLPQVECCTVEFDLPPPHYTYTTLQVLEKKYPNTSFVLLMGTDLLTQLPRWKFYRELMDRYPLYIYPRKTPEAPAKALAEHPNVQHFDAPTLELSATQIRQLSQAGKDVSYLLPPEIVADYLD